MLVLSRKVGEKIQVGDDITIEILAIKGNRVKIGIKAPGSYRIRRFELPEPPSTEKNTKISA
jgi:carbon storage regulator